MNEMGLSGKRKKQKYHSYLGEVGRIAENLINRNFISDGPNKKWTTDVSQFNCPFGKAYLSPILDMGMGDIVAWDLSLSPNLTIFSISSIETVSFSLTIGIVLFSINVSKVLQTLLLI